MKPHNRIATYDLMKFFGIIFVIIGHMTTVGVKFIFSFHMPLFFIIAGYFFHQKNVSNSLKSDVQRLVCPYLFTSGVIVFTYLLLSFVKSDVDVIKWVIAALYGNGSSNHSSLYLSKVPSIGAIWFLLALFWCKNIFNFIYGKTKFWLPICLIISLVAIAVDDYVVNLPFAILPGLAAMIFYSIGVLIRKKGGFLSISPFLWSILILVWFMSFLFSDMSMVRCYYQNIFINIIGACGGCYVIFLVSDIISTYHNKLITIFELGGGKQHGLSLHSSL